MIFAICRGRNGHTGIQDARSSKRFQIRTVHEVSRNVGLYRVEGVGGIGALGEQHSARKTTDDDRD